MTDETYTPTIYVVTEDGAHDITEVLPGDSFDFGIGVACVVTGTGTEPDPLGGPDLLRFVGQEIGGLSTYERSFAPTCRVTETTVLPEYLVTEYDYDFESEI